VAKDDDATWLQCLSILSSLLEHTRIALSDTSISYLIESLVIPGVKVIFFAIMVFTDPLLDFFSPFD
jgi:hypothetical protein